MKPRRGAANRPDGLDPKTDVHWRAWDHYRKAVQVLDRRLKSFRSPQTLTELGELHLLMDEHEKAEPVLKEAIEQNEGSARAHKGLGDLFLRSGRYDVAIKALKASLQRVPDDLTVQELLALCYRKSKALEDAETEYQKILSISRFQVDSLVGLGEVYLDMSDQRADKEPTGREDLFTRAIDLFTEAIQVLGSEDRPTVLSGNPASIYYLRGYATQQLYETSPLRRGKKLVKEARDDFLKCAGLDPDQHKAVRAAKILNEQLLKFTPRSLLEDWCPLILMVFAAALFAVAQVGLFRAILPLRKEELVLTPASFAVIQNAVKGEDVIKALKLIENKPFPNEEKLATGIRSVLGEKATASVNIPLIQDAASKVSQVDYERMDAGSYLLLTFGAMLFMIAGAFLPQLTSLKLAGIQLEKGTAERVDTVRPTGISRST